MPSPTSSPLTSYIPITSSHPFLTGVSSTPSPPRSRKLLTSQRSLVATGRQATPPFKFRNCTDQFTAHLLLLRTEPVLHKKLQHLSVDEVANTITHGAGLVLSVIGFVVILAMASIRANAVSIIAVAIYGLSLVILYGSSTIYHSTTSPTMKRRMQVADHCGIYLLIAGTYTPFGVIILKGSLGQGLLIALWLLAFAGIIAKLILHDRFPAVSVVSYL